MSDKQGNGPAGPLDDLPGAPTGQDTMGHGPGGPLLTPPPVTPPVPPAP